MTRHGLMLIQLDLELELLSVTLPIMIVASTLKYRKFSNKHTGCYDKPSGGASRLKRTFPPSRGFLRNENRTIIS